MTKRIIFGSFVLAFLSPILGCSSQPEIDVPAAKAKEDNAATAVNASEEADKLFVSRCASCHGMDGQGDGPGAANLNPKPRNYHDKAWQASVTDEQIEKTIVYGGAAVGKSPNMPANPDLNEKAAVVSALRQRIRDFAK